MFELLHHRHGGLDDLARRHLDAEAQIVFDRLLAQRLQ
jgi:hypothetical protein